MMEMKVVMRDPKKSDYFYEESIKTLRTNIEFQKETENKEKKQQRG